jgi:hypothetical protein
MNAGSDWLSSRALRLNRLEQSFLRFLRAEKGVKKGSQKGVAVGASGRRKAFLKKRAQA